jgi:uncharacterized membrane protein YphA (DoxX/SURF4 family)
MSHQDEIEKLATALRITLGSTAVAAGADKFFNFLTDWEKYLSPMVAERLPISPGTFMRIVGVIEMAVGSGILLGYERPAGYICSAWLLAITGNLLTKPEHLDVAARDLNMALEAYTLARLAGMKAWSNQSELREELSEVGRARIAS